MRKTDIQNIFRNSNTLVYVAMSILSKEKSNVIPELLYTLKRDDLLKLITLFGGETLYIPDPTEFKFYIDCAIAAYYFKSQDQRWPWIKTQLELNDKELSLVKSKVLDWSKSCSREEIKALIDFKEDRGSL